MLQTDSVAENFVEYARKKHKQCRITLAREKFYERGQSMNLPKGSFLTPLLNEQYDTNFLSMRIHLNFIVF